jgi:small subunit ribosomal protein S1
MEDVLAASDEQLARKPVHRGMVTTGEVIMLQQEGIVVDVGAKIEGLLPYNQIFEEETTAAEAAKHFKAGDQIQVYVIRADVPNNTIILSRKRAEQEQAWNVLQEVFEQGKPVEVDIVDQVKGGLVANIGVRAFLPASQVDVRRVSNLDPYVGQKMTVRIIELNRRRNRVIISRRAILEEELKEKKAEIIKKLEPGAKLEGEVVEITEFGAFVNLGGIDGLVHRSEMTHGRFNHPKDVVSVGDKVNVEILDMDLERERINLSMKKLADNPWENVLARHQIGERVQGKVTNLTQFGAFVEIEAGLEGLIHVSEMSWTKRIRHPKEMLTEGDEVEAMVLKIDTNAQRISLGLRQTQPDPWSSLPDRFPPGTEVTGPITGITEFGVFMEIEEGIEGLVHISELAHEHIETITDHFNRGDEVTAVILNIDPIEQRASLSRKRLLPYTAGDVDETGAPRVQQGGGKRGGRRGGRRSSEIDYDYSYAADNENTSRSTTKLGDVYADLFAQFGLADGDDAKGDDAKDDASGTAATSEAQAAEPAPEPAATESEPQATEPAAETAEAAEPQAEAPSQDDTPAEDSEPPADAIDANEAAALLTAALKQGKKPAEEASTSEAENGEDAAPASDEAPAADASGEESSEEEAKS